MHTSHSTRQQETGPGTTDDLVYLHTLVNDLLTTPDVANARTTMIERLREATDARAVAIISVDHARLRCRLDALLPDALRTDHPAEVPLNTQPLAALLGLPGPTLIPTGATLPWLAPGGEGSVTLVAPLRRRSTVTGLLLLRLGPDAHVPTGERLLATTANAAAIGLDAVRREERDEFLAMVRHDIYNPMTVAMFHAEMLAESLEAKSDRESADLALSVLSCMNAVCDLVTNFFYLEAIDEGAPAIHPEELDLVELSREIVDAHRPTASNKQLALEVSGACPPIMADRRQLSRVLVNLVGNALKYTEGPGRVDVDISSDATHVTLAVRDTGSGLEPEALDRLFQKHARFHQHLNIPGSGLGLYLAKAIVDAHGGTLDVASTPGEGSVFTLRLPRC